MVRGASMITRQETEREVVGSVVMKSRGRVGEGSIHLNAELRHFTMWVYAVPVERVKGLVPASMRLETSELEGRVVAWLSVVSYGDEGPRGFGKSGIAGFEQTTYRLHVIADGRPACYVLSLSLGSLSAVAARHLWSMPWRLGAMEFEVGYDAEAERYRSYRLRTQSEVESAHWEIEEGGEVGEGRVPGSVLSGEMDHLFRRRDGSTGRVGIGYGLLDMRSGRVIAARSEMLERMGILTAEELLKPVMVGVQNRVEARLMLPTVEAEAGGAKSKESGKRERRRLVAAA